jgi:hypothetical protein
MATTIHLPDAVLEAVDKNAAAEGVSRSRYITRVLTRSAGAAVDPLERSRAFSRGFRPMPKESRALVDEWFGT